MYRTIDCSIWSDPWFAELQTAPKLLFIYLFTNPRTTPAGTCEISARQIAFDTDIDPSAVGAALSQLSDKVAWWPELNMVWIKNFYRRQAGNSNPENYKTSAIRALKTVPREVRDGVTYAYPELIDPSATHTKPIPKGSPTLTRVETNRTDKETTIETNDDDIAHAREREASSLYVETLNGALPKLEAMFAAVDKQFTAVWLWGVLAEVEAEVGPLARDQLGRGLDLALDQLRRSVDSGKVKSPRPFARKLIATYLTEQRDDHHAA